MQPGSSISLICYQFPIRWKIGEKYPKGGKNYEIFKIGKGGILGGRIYEILNIFTNMTYEGLEIQISLIQMDINLTF